jgi:hypothetical protein
VVDYDKRAELDAETVDGEAGETSAFPPIFDEIHQLIAAARQMASAELDYQKARMGLMAKAAGWIAGSVALVLALLFFVLMALVVGLLLALAPLIGHWGALGLVVGGLLLATLLVVLVALRSLRRFMALVRDGKGEA